MNEPKDEPRHGAEILHAPIHTGYWYYWTCTCGARSGPPFYATVTIASREWGKHVRRQGVGTVAQ